MPATIYLPRFQPELVCTATEFTVNPPPAVSAALIGALVTAVFGTFGLRHRRRGIEREDLAPTAEDLQETLRWLRGMSERPTNDEDREFLREKRCSYERAAQRWLQVRPQLALVNNRIDAYLAIETPRTTRGPKGAKGTKGAKGEVREVCGWQRGHAASELRTALLEAQQQVDRRRSSRR